MPSYISRPVTLLGALLLFHACYSAYEHSKFHENPPSTSTPTSVPRLPLDISLETILSVFLVCVGLVFGAEELKPVTWRVWAGNTDRKSGGGGPFQVLEERLGFMDIRARRKEFADWVRDKGAAEKR